MEKRFCSVFSRWHGVLGGVISVVVLTAATLAYISSRVAAGGSARPQPPQVASVPAEWPTRQLPLHVALQDPGGIPLESVHVWVNNVPVYGMAGHKLPSNTGRWVGNLPPFDLVRGVNGLNKVEIAVRNQKGVFSLREPRYVTYRPPAGQDEEKPNLYVLAVGVSQYQNERLKLRFAESDAQTVLDLLRNAPTNVARFGAMASERLQLLGNRQAVRSEILRFREVLLKSKADDTVVLFFSGHGKVEGGTFYFGTWDVDFTPPTRNGLSYNDILSLLDGIPARNRLVLLDACYSGPAPAAPATPSQPTSDPTPVRPNPPAGAGIDTGGQANGKVAQPQADDSDYVSTKDVDVSLADRSQLALSDGFTLMLQLFADLDRGVGAQVIAAAHGNDVAYERGALKSGLFTKAVAEALAFPQLAKPTASQSPGLTIPLFREYVRKRVVELSKGTQTPTPRQENLEFGDWRIL